MADTRSPGGRHKSKQAMRDYQKVLMQLENLEIGVGDQCRKEFTGGAGVGGKYSILQLGLTPRASGLSCVPSLGSLQGASPTPLAKCRVG